MTTCQVTVYERTAGRWGTPTTIPVPCGQPVARYGLCEKHAGEHERLCPGCGRCGREPHERFPCGCVRYGDVWVPEDCSVHALGGVL